MALDSFTNTGLSTLASGITAVQTTLTVAAGTGSRFPSSNFNVVVWNSTDFANPIDDTDREIVRCTSRAADVLTITRGQEGTAGVAHNTAGKTYSVALAITAKFRDDVQARTIKGFVETSGGGAWTIDASLNLSSITDNAVGDFTINWTTGFTTANYPVVGTAIHEPGGGAAGMMILESTATAKTSSLVRMKCFVATTLTDPSQGVSVIAGGDQ